MSNSIISGSILLYSNGRTDICWFNARLLDQLIIIFFGTNSRQHQSSIEAEVIGSFNIRFQGIANKKYIPFVLYSLFFK